MAFFFAAYKYDGLLDAAFDVMTAGQYRSPASVATYLVRLTLTFRNGSSTGTSVW